MKKKFLKHFRRNESGSTLVYVAVLLPVGFGFLAMGLDVASWHLEKRETQTMADATALAAALNQVDDETTGDTSLTTVAHNAGISAAAINGFDVDDGQTLVINKPPTGGAMAGNTDAIEAIVQSPLPSYLSVFYTTGQESTISRAVAVIEDPGEACIWALNPSAPGALTVSGTATVSVECGVFVNSDDTEAAVGLNGKNACLTATEINVVGAADGGAGNCFEPMPDEGAYTRSDPLGDMPEPPYDPAGCDVSGDTKINGNTGETLSPGTYCGDISINTDELVDFEAGIYVINGGILTINGQANVTGDEVMFFFTENSPGSAVTINGGANIDFSAPTSGDYQDVLFYQSRDADAGEQKFNGGADMDMGGIMYFPNADMKFAGNGGTKGAMLVSDTLTFTGTSDLSGDPGELPITSPFLDPEIKLVE